MTAVDGKRPDELVFTMPGGTVMRLANWRRVTFVPAALAPGSAAGSAFTTFGIRRHTTASLMIQAG